MTSLRGKIVIDEDGTICMKMQIAPANPEEYEIPFEELLEDFIGRRVKIDVIALKSLSEVKGK